MSDQKPARLPWFNSGCLFVFGIILLLPGGCSLLFLADSIRLAGWYGVVPYNDADPHNLIWGAGLVIGAGGAALITLAIRRRW